MKESIIYETPALYRDSFRMKGFAFGEGEKALAVVGAMRGNEYQQLYIASRLVHRLREMEAAGRLMPGKEILVVPSVNPGSMNIGKRFWGIDNTDINRMFPGYDKGETTQRIAAGLFEAVDKYRYGIQFPSFYMPGRFMPHVRITKTGFEDVERAADFGMPHVVLRDPRPYDTTTLNYNWQIWETKAYSLYSNATRRIDHDSAEQVLQAVERFLIVNGLAAGEAQPAPAPMIFNDDELTDLRTEAAGLYRMFVKAGEHVAAGTLCAAVYDPLTGETLQELRAPEDGVVFFLHDDPVVYVRTAVVKLLPDNM